MKKLIFMSLLGASMFNLMSDAMAQDIGSRVSEHQGVYIPGLGDIMGAIQMRHAKLWFAGIKGNWQLAAYELDEIKEGFEDAAKFQPDFKGRPILHMVQEITTRPLSDLQEAIETKNTEKFAIKFGQLTNACNSCHQASGYGFISIQRPKQPPFSNQRFEMR